MKKFTSNIIDGEKIDHALLIVNVSTNFEPGAETYADFLLSVSAEFARISAEVRKGDNGGSGNLNDLVDSDLIEEDGEY